MGNEPFAEVALHMRGFQISQMVHVAAELRLADRVGDANRPIAELAAETGAHPQMLLRLCRALAAFGIFAVDDTGRLSQTPKSACLRSDATPTLHYAARYWGMANSWGAWGNFLHTIMTGEPAFEMTHGLPPFAYNNANPKTKQVFDEFMQHSPDDRHAAVAAAYDFAGIVVDVGGGTGGLLRAILDAYAGVRGILADQPEVVAGAAQVLGPQADRCDVVATDFFASVPSGGDIYTMAQVLHDWNDESCLKILANCRAAMKPASRLLVIERPLEDLSGRILPMNFLADLHMMVLFPGAKERTPAEYASLFRDSGLREPRFLPTRSAFSIIETGLAA